MPYGTNVTLLESQARTPVSTATTLVFVGFFVAANSRGQDEPILIHNMAEFTAAYTQYHGGGNLTDAAHIAFELLGLSQAVFINVYNAAGFDGDADDETGIYAIQKIYPKYGLTPDLVVCPVPEGLTNAQLLKVRANIVKANGHWNGICLYDVAETSAQVDNDHAVVAEIVSSKQISDERFIACWGHVKIGDSIYPSSTYKACLLARQDALYNNIPMRSIGNLPAADVSCIVLESEPTKPVFLSEAQATQLADNGITSFINVGSNVYYTWGDSTSALTASGITDERGRFDTTIRIMLMLGNRFQRVWRNEIDSPMDVGLRGDIISEEQGYLDYLKSVGALIGYPKCEFRPDDNTAATVQAGQFYFTDILTATTPARYINLNIVFTSEGYSVLLEG